jgi:nucleoid-associated protein YgaU
MVRKDVKIGAVVVGILIAVLIVYVLVVPGGGPPQGDAPVAAAPTDESFKNQMIRGETQLAGIGKTETAELPGIASNQPAAVAANTQSPAAPASNTRTDPFGPADEKWMMALNTGVVPASARMTAERPQAPGSAISASPRSTSELSPVPNSALAINPTTRPAGRTHVVQPGENFARIAESVYGSQVYYKDLMAANPNVRPEKLRPGMVLHLPDVKEVKGKGNTEDDSPAPAIDQRLEYRVQAGDSMHKIAAKLYNDQDMWQDLYNLNKARIGNDPARLKVGMILKLPRPPAAAQ